MDFRSQESGLERISTDEDTFQRGTALDDLNLYVRSRAFRGGTLTAVMSEVTLDLREAKLSPEGATVSVQAALSTLHVLVPRDWDIACDVQAIWGGVDGERFPPAAGKPGPRLHLTGTVVAGGLCVR